MSETMVDLIIDEGVQPDKIFAIHITVKDKEDIERTIRDEVFFMGGPIDIKLDCGGIGGPWTVDTFPREDVPCPCGNQTHWLVKYEHQETSDDI